MRRALLAILALTLPMSTFAGFNALYDGVPDLELTQFIQKTARTYTLTVCNRGDTANGLGSLVLSLRGSVGKTAERTIDGVSIQSGRCQSFEISSAGTFGKPADRNYDIVATIRWDGARREIETSNNKYILRSTTPMTDREVISNNPSTDLWGNSNSATTWYQPTNNNSYNNGSYYNNTSTVDPINFSPAGPFFGQGSNTSNGVVYIYRENPYAGTNSYSTYCTGSNCYPCRTGYRSGTKTNTYNTFDYVNGSNNSTNNSNYYYDCNTSNNYNNNCYNSNNGNCNYNYNNSNCYNNNSSCYENRADLVVRNIKQNGIAREFIVNVCNNGSSMTSGTTTNLQLTIGGTVRSVNFSSSLAANTCQDVYVQFALMYLYYSGSYTVRADVDTLNAILERDKGNNSYTQNVYVNYN